MTSTYVLTGSPIGPSLSLFALPPNNAAGSAWFALLTGFAAKALLTALSVEAVCASESLEDVKLSLNHLPTISVLRFLILFSI